MMLASLHCRTKANAEGLNSRFSFTPRLSYNDATDPVVRRELNLLFQKVIATIYGINILGITVRGL